MRKVFEESPNTLYALKYFSKVLGQSLAPMGLARLLVITGASNPNPRCCGIFVAPSQEYKSTLSALAQRFFSKDMYLELSGDETLHGLKKTYGERVNAKDYEYLLNLHNKCLIIDEGNLLLQAMNTKSKYRLLSSIAKLFTSWRSDYKSELGSFRVVGRITIIMNIVTELFAKMEFVLRMSTIGQRSYIGFTWLTDKEKIRIRENYRKFRKIKPEIRIEPYRRTIKNLGEYEGELVSLAKDYAILGIRNLTETLHITEALACQNACLNGRNYLTEDDIKVVRMLRSYVSDPRKTDTIRVIGFLKEGRTYRDICHLLNKPLHFKTTISRIKKRAEMRGILDYGIDRPEWWKDLGVSEFTLSDSSPARTLSQARGKSNRVNS